MRLPGYTRWDVIIPGADDGMPAASDRAFLGEEGDVHCADTSQGIESKLGCSCRFGDDDKDDWDG